MLEKEANEMAASGVWGGARKQIREAVKVFKYKVAAAGPLFGSRFGTPRVLLEQG